jgi:HAD superfamily hydrolase (TIGR01509 family)
MLIRAILFDFDGLILDTESSALACWRELYAEFGVTFPHEQWMESLGRAVRTFDPYGDLAERSGGKVDRETLFGMRRRREEELAGALVPCAGVAELMGEGRETGLKMGVVSSSSRGWVGGHLERVGLRGYLEVMVCREDCSTHKPEPGPYLMALEKLEVRAEEAVALEDSPNGIKAAKGAGIFTVAVPNPVTRVLELSHADWVTETLRGVTEGELLLRARGVHNQGTKATKYQEDP